MYWVWCCCCVFTFFSYHLGKEPQSLSIYMQWNQLFLTLLVYYKCRDLFSSTDQQYMAFVESPQNEDTTILPKMPGPMYCASCVCPSPTSNLRQQFLSWASLWCPWQPHLLMLKCYCRVVFFFFWNLLKWTVDAAVFTHPSTCAEFTAGNLPAWIKFAKTHHLKADLCILTD